MRTVPAAFVAFLLFSCCSPAWSQNGDPFGGASGSADPFGGAARPADPFGGAARPADPFGTPQSNAQAKKLQAQQARNRAVQQAKQALAGGRKPVQVQPAQSNEAEMRIKAALNDETTQTFIETPLVEAIQTISRTHNIPMVIDNRALEEIGLDSSAPISIDLRNVSLRSYLRLMLRDLDLTYLVKDEVMQITTVEAAEENLIMEMYVLPPNLAAKSDQVIKVLTSMVVPDTWEQLGGNSSAMAVDHVLVISSTSDVIDQSEAFLAKLVEKYGK